VEEKGEERGGADALFSQ